MSKRTTPERKSSVRPYYLFTAVVLGIGAVLSVFAESWGSLGIFTVLCGMAIWVAARVDRSEAGVAAEPADRRVRPSERRRQKRAERDA